MNWKVPFFDLVLGDEERKAILNVIDCNWLTSGPRIAEFEAKFSAMLGQNVGAVAVSSATAALHLSLLALRLGQDDEVIVPSLTFVACANAIRYVGAEPVFADITSEIDWNISAADVEAKITSRTRAIMVVHYAGYACDMHKLSGLAEKYGLLLIEDCSHSPRCAWKGRSVGTFGATGCFSFYSNKNMTTGEGGMIISGDPQLVERLRTLRSHGITTSTYQRFKGHAFGYDVPEVGFNYRLDEMRAAMGVAQLQKLPEITIQRKTRVQRYREFISNRLPQVRIPFLGRDEESSYHIFPVLLPGNEKVRNGILRAMADRGVQCSIHYRPIHTFTAYKGVAADVPITERVAPSVLTLPLFPTLSDAQIIEVVKALEDCLKEYNYSS
jgi:dTDP-4-amino-4,6-dideoxygalactose transaminase